jgi:hypothetical protein
VKISGTCTMSHQPFPYDDIWEPVLRVIDAFGLDRCMWSTAQRLCGPNSTPKPPIVSINSNAAHAPFETFA